MRTAFISGHLDLTKEEFAEHYEPEIRRAHAEGHAFVVGDAPGCDFMAQRLLVELNSEVRGPSNGIDRGATVHVYHMFDAPRMHAGRRAQRAPTVGGFTSDKERDAAATAASDYDIAWVRPGREKSGTAKNIARRKNRGT
jgi:hypothetical protein